VDLFYCKIDFGNFGDDMNEWFWNETFPDHGDIAPGTTMLGIGSLLWRENVEDFDRVLVMGSGAGVGKLPDKVDHVNFAFVRGPMTAAQFGLPPSVGISDPACYVPRLEEFQGLGAGKGTIVVPHCSTARLPVDWAKIAGDAGMRFVSPSDESKAVIRRIAAAELVITESLHGAIIADAFRVPWIPMAISPQFGSFKWLDWGKSIETEFEVTTAMSALKRAYGVLVGLRSRVRGMKTRLLPGQKAGAPVRVAHADAVDRSQSYRLQQIDKDRVRTLISRHADRIEGMLAKDLRKAAAQRPYLSRDAVLAARQDRIAERIGEVRAELLAAAS